MELGGRPDPGRDDLDRTPPPLSPEHVGRQRFGTSFRGYDQQEVRTFLAQVADELARLRARHDELQTELEAVRQAPPPAVDREMLMSALGEETARIIRTAEEAAEDIRTKAEEAASRLRADAAAEAEAMRAEASDLLGARRAEAESAASERARRAEEEAQAVFADATWRAQEVIREAEATRDAVLSDLAEKRRVAHLQVERLGAGRDRLLEAYAAVRENLEEAVSTLDHAPEAARRAAEAAERSAGGSRPVTGGPGVPSAQSTASPEAELAREPEPEPEPEPAPVEPQPLPEFVERVPAPQPEPEPAFVEPEPPPEPEFVEPQPQPEPVRTAQAENPAEEVFARIRAERAAPSEPVAEAEELATPAEAAIPEAPDPEDHLQRRDLQLDPIVGPLVRKLKRSLQDEQNDVLDRIRSRKGRPSLDEALGTENEQAARYSAVARAAMEEAGAAGAQSVGAGPNDQMELASIAGRLAEELIRPVRRAVTRALKAAAGGDDEQAVVDGVGAAYRDWRSARLEKVASEHLAAAYAAGVYGAAGSARLAWIVDDGGDPCPDCEDNALAGPTPRGEPFPTGQLLPPAHSGCRCLVVRAP